jgi:asparagine synthase (glutamine-hydrolysing)
MCGIAGYLYTDPARSVAPDVLEQMCAVIHHRGPDEWGMWCDGAVGIGMKRLQIIDLAGGHQPMASADNRLHIVFNGEIYNYRELRQQLEGRGCRFRTTSDTETILYAYQEYGNECVTYLRGMFAFAIWDRQNRSLFMARDRFGKKPLHYFHDGRKLVFSSEIKSILQHPEVTAEVYRPAVPRYLAYGYIPDPYTMFRGISKLLPGHSLTWKEGAVKVRPYWDLVFKPDDPPKEDAFYLDEVDCLLREAVKIRLVSDVPLGAFLSGGIDSSLVVALMALQLGKPVKTFSIGFEDNKYNELPYARLVAQKYGTDHHEEIVKPDAEAVLPEIIRNFDEPFADSSAIPTYYVSRLARHHVTVALSGDGGDELFAGYNRYYDSRLAERIDRCPQWLKGPLLGGMASLMPESAQGINTLRYLAADADSRYAAKMTGKLASRFRRVFSVELLEAMGDYVPGAEVLASLQAQSCLDKITRRQYADVKNYLLGDILTKVDRTSMLVSLEARAPFLDHRLAEVAARIPSSLKNRNRSLKYMLKTLAYRYLPRELIERSKMGFAIPLGHWINNEWCELSHDLVLSSRALQRNNINPAYLKQVFAEHRRGKRDYSSFIWALMVLEMWCRRYIDGEG